MINNNILTVFALSPRDITRKDTRTSSPTDCAGGEITHEHVAPIKGATGVNVTSPKRSVIGIAESQVDEATQILNWVRNLQYSLCNTTVLYVWRWWSRASLGVKMYSARWLPRGCQQTVQCVTFNGTHLLHTKTMQHIHDDKHKTPQIPGATYGSSSG